MSFDRLPLPYALDALAPFVSRDTLDAHYNHHHAAYVDKANAFAAEHRLGEISLQDAVLESAARPDRKSFFNNVAQAWNHDFLWRSMRPPGAAEKPVQLSEEIDAVFGSWENFRRAFVEKALAQFGSGWAWLVLADDKLAIMTTANGDTPATVGHVPLLTIDVWEHAYYLDYRYDRKRYLETVFDRLADWSFADSLLSLAREPDRTPATFPERLLWRGKIAANV